jgi:hypothetical protein
MVPWKAGRRPSNGGWRLANALACSERAACGEGTRLRHASECWPACHGSPTLAPCPSGQRVSTNSCRSAASRANLALGCVSTDAAGSLHGVRAEDRARRILGQSRSGPTSHALNQCRANCERFSLGAGAPTSVRSRERGPALSPNLTSERCVAVNARSDRLGRRSDGTGSPTGRMGVRTASATPLRGGVRVQAPPPLPPQASGARSAETRRVSSTDRAAIDAQVRRTRIE